MSAGSDHDELCRLLNQLTPGLLPRDVFHAIARLMVTTTYVVVPLLRRDGKILTFLPRRGADDLYYPSMLNAPGTVIRASDESLSAVYHRLAISEFPGIPIKGDPVFVDRVYDLIVRGREISLIHWVEMSDTADLTQLIDVDELPGDVVPTDRARIAMAADDYRKRAA
ncbi:hypothetical protein [Microvirga solisilvae]|uniref:hypothetical protein n=1 Tax=Microvirga solisilvae TaxID=2919498 RepID=UPI001FAE8AD0|nr:hypothetical protein [Microvirga solisilvae]